jgi:hypothetical protein
MRRIAALLVALPLLLGPALAQQPPAADDDNALRRGVEQLSEGSKLILRSLLGEIAPLIEELRGKIDDLADYEMPEVLPNGDIIIRRKTPLPGAAPSEDGEIDI